MILSSQVAGSRRKIDGLETLCVRLQTSSTSGLPVKLLGKKLHFLRTHSSGLPQHDHLLPRRDCVPDVGREARRSTASDPDGRASGDASEGGGDDRGEVRTAVGSRPFSRATVRHGQGEKRGERREGALREVGAGRRERALFARKLLTVRASDEEASVDGAFWSECDAGCDLVFEPLLRRCSTEIVSAQLCTPKDAKRTFIAHHPNQLHPLRRNPRYLPPDPLADLLQQCRDEARSRAASEEEHRLVPPDLRVPQSTVRPVEENRRRSPTRRQSQQLWTKPLRGMNPQNDDHHPLRRFRVRMQVRRVRDRVGVRLEWRSRDEVEEVVLACRPAMAGGERDGEANGVGGEGGEGSTRDGAAVADEDEEEAHED